MDIFDSIETAIADAFAPPAPSIDVAALPPAAVPPQPAPAPPVAAAVPAATDNPVALALRAVAPHLKPPTHDAWVAALQVPMDAGGITANRNRIAAFMGEVAEESGGFVDVTENMNYSASRMMAVWPSHFTSLEQAQGYAYQPEKLANHVYADRNGNGDEASGDGYLFRGRGLIQLTGRSNYTAFAAAMKRELADTTDWIASMQGAAYAACWFWSSRALNKNADAFDIQTITQRINGGLNGYSIRLALCNAALGALK